jgi:hypothetical protein
MINIILFRNNMPFESVPVSEFVQRQAPSVLQTPSTIRVQSFKRVTVPLTNNAAKK